MKRDEKNRAVNLEALLTPTLGNDDRRPRGAMDRQLFHNAGSSVEHCLMPCAPWPAGFLVIAQIIAAVSSHYTPTCKAPDPMGSITVTTLSAPNPPPLALARPHP